MKTIDYQLDAKEKLAQCGATIKIVLSNTKDCPWSNGESGHHYKFTIKTIHGTYSSDFWDSIANRESKKEPSAYDVLYCLTWHNPGDFESFCSEFGYDTDSRKAFKTFLAVTRGWNSIFRIFPAESAREMLATIQ